MHYFLAIFFSIISYELVVHLKLIKNLKKVLKTSKKILRIIFSKKISDNWKEKSLLKNAVETFLSSFKIILILTLILIIIYFVQSINNNFLSLITSIKGLIIISVYLYIYHKVRNLLL